MNNKEQYDTLEYNKIALVNWIDKPVRYDFTKGEWYDNLYSLDIKTSDKNGNNLLILYFLRSVNENRRIDFSKEQLHYLVDNLDMNQQNSEGKNTLFYALAMRDPVIEKNLLNKIIEKTDLNISIKVNNQLEINGLHLLLDNASRCNFSKKMWKHILEKTNIQGKYVIQFIIEYKNHINGNHDLLKEKINESLNCQTPREKLLEMLGLTSHWNANRFVQLLQLVENNNWLENFFKKESGEDKLYQNSPEYQKYILNKNILQNNKAADKFKI